MPDDKIVRKKTIKDFNNQWKLQGELNEDYWSSDEVLIDQFDKIFLIDNVKDKIIADVGAGTGRIVKSLLNYEPLKVYAIEPSEIGIKKINKNLSHFNNLEVIQSDGLNFKTSTLCDYIFSLGVIHHIKNPTDVLTNIRRNLKKDGKIIIWVYGYENNELYIFLYKFLSLVTKYIPDRLLYIFCHLLNLIIQPYIWLCHFISLPLKSYLLNVFNKFGWKKRTDVIFDQLNPEYSKYYKKNEIEKQLLDAGFKNLRFSHRHGYSWTVVGENI
mgnify:FL=1